MKRKAWVAENRLDILKMAIYKYHTVQQFLCLNVNNFCEEREVMHMRSLQMEIFPDKDGVRERNNFKQAE